MKTMAEKTQGVLSEECARMLMTARVRTAAVNHILPQAADKARLIRRARCRIAAAKIDRLPRPQEAADE